MIIKPTLITDEDGRVWLSPGLSLIHQRMLGLSHEELREIAEKGGEIEIPDEWPEAHWEYFEEGKTHGYRVTWDSTEEESQSLDTPTIHS